MVRVHSIRKYELCKVASECVAGSIPVVTTILLTDFKNKSNLRPHSPPNIVRAILGTMAERLGVGLQILSDRFDSCLFLGRL